MVGLRAAFLGVCVSFLGCTTVTPVATPSGRQGLLIRCQNTVSCYKKANQACGGAYRIVDSGTDVHSGGLTSDTETTKEILVECGAPPTQPATAQAQSSENSKLDEASAPTSAAGFNFGDSVDATNALCMNAGHEWKGNDTRYRCSGTPVDTGLDAQARLAFCKDTLCRIDIVVPPPSDGALLSARIEKVVALLMDRYGKPTGRDVALPQSCTGAALPQCLETDRAHFNYTWAWKGRKAVTLSLGSKKVREAYEDPPKRTANELTAVKSIRVRYDEGRTPDPAKSAASAEAGPEAERDVSGL